jgi:hypothetical protein
VSATSTSATATPSTPGPAPWPSTPARRPITPGSETWDGNELIADIFGSGAVERAIAVALVDNTSTTQAGVAPLYNGRHGHGDRLTFTKTRRTHAYSGFVDGVRA